MLMTTSLEIAIAFGITGAVFMLLSNLMKRMVALRLFAVGANSLFIVQALLTENWIFFWLQTTLLVINVYRLWTLRQLVLSLEQAKADAPIKDWLLPQMKKHSYKAGTALFKAGDVADRIYYIRSGRVRSPELGDQTLGPGKLVGEIGVFSKDHRRSVTVICDTDCVCDSMTDEALYLLYLQNPRIGFYLIRLIAQQLSTELQHRVAQTAVYTP